MRAVLAERMGLLLKPPLSKWLFRREANFSLVPRQPFDNCSAVFLGYTGTSPGIYMWG